MQRLTLGRWGLWVYTAGIFAWIFPNMADGDYVNAFTDVVVVAFGTTAAVGLGRAVDGIGTGPLRVGLSGILVGQFMQNAIASATDWNTFSAAPRLVVMAAAVLVAIGVKRWQEDDWDREATPWLALGFAGFAFEPLYYQGRGLMDGSFRGPFALGALLVLVGSALAAWAFWRGRGGSADE